MNLGCATKMPKRKRGPVGYLTRKNVNVRHVFNGADFSPFLKYACGVLRGRIILPRAAKLSNSYMCACRRIAFSFCLVGLSV